MDKVLEQILTKLEKLDKIEQDVQKVKQDVARLDKIEMDIAAVKNDVKKMDKKIDGIADAVAKTMEDITEIKDRLEEQNVEIRVIKGEAANA